MPTDPRNLKPGEFCQLVNSTPIGDVLTEPQLRRQRNQAGLRVGSGKTVDLIKYTAWIAGKRHRTPQKAGSSPAPDDLLDRHDSAYGAAVSAIGTLQSRCRNWEPVIAALLTEPSHIKAALKAGMSESTLYRLLRLADFRKALEQARKELMQTSMGRAQAYAGEAVQTLATIARTGRRESDRIRASTQLLAYGWQGLSRADLLQEAPTPANSKAPTTAEAVKIIGKQLRQIELSNLSLVEKARLTVSLADALHRALEADDNEKRTAALEGVLLPRTSWNES